MRRYELVGRRDLALRDVPVPQPGPGEVLIRVGACTICNRSDLVYYHYLGERDHCAQGFFGHEVSGTVEAVGAGVTRTEPGARVFARAPLSGGYADFALVREISVGHLPDQIPFEQGAILQLLPLAVHATRGVRLGDRVAVIGQGPVGLMTLQVLARRGASDIVVADLDPWRLERSRALGAHRTVQTDDAAREDWSALGGEFDVAIDAVGTPYTANACVGLVRHNGLVVLLGTHHVDTHVTFDLVAWEKKGLRIHTSAEPTDPDRAAAMKVAERLAPGIELAPLLSQAYPLERLPEAIERLSASSVLDPAESPRAQAGPPPRTLKLAIVP
ncbi:L-iditol 2-dehydrogenase [Catenulispora sp. GP43]|uniref:zinc-dependent alcohol dehydrogenase n=1 Tax=Catenulispora sp. GP43 TaxID=3156263 RepID=UPI003511429E